MDAVFREHDHVHLWIGIASFLDERADMVGSSLEVIGSLHREELRLAETDYY